MRKFSARLAALAILLCALNAAAEPAPIGPRQGWIVIHTSFPFPELVQRTEAAVQANAMNLVNAASASEGAKAQGFTIPGNRVLGVFRNDFARRMLAASIPAGIEAPIRLYLVENQDGTSTIAYRPPSIVFRPYFDGASADLKMLAADLDPIFEKIVSDAIK
jgi:uncharacterized protein (DUF302 family)